MTILDIVNILYRLEFNNSGHVISRDCISALEMELQFPLTLESFADAFPYHFYFDRGLRISRVGPTLNFICPYLDGNALIEYVTISKPMIQTEWEPVRFSISICRNILN